MDRKCVLLRIESVLAFDIANISDRKSNSGFDSAIFRAVNFVPMGDVTAMPMDSRWLWKVF